jgi:XTP/dITP diphosphohydrolase/tetrapyrrole methylase family protein/MazG family protein
MPLPIPSPNLPPLQRLREIMHLLRSPGGCPWDAEQTHETLIKHLIEEAYEVADAVKGGDRDEIVDELGDLLLQPVFHAEIASENGQFDLDDVATAICEKLIRRHPHVFDEAKADSPAAVLSQWDEIKLEEKGETTDGLDPYLKKANEGLPALMSAQKIQKKVAKVGFDWAAVGPVLEKIHEELSEVEEAIQSGHGNEVAEEIGDLLFAVVNLARQTGSEAELLLHRTNRKFVERFSAMETRLRKEGQALHSATLEEMDEAWNFVKVHPPSIRDKKSE